MPMIQPYERQAMAQGQLNTQANPDMFGAQIGQSLQGLGEATQRFAASMQERNETQEVTDVHVQMAKARAEWTQQLQDRQNSAQPGDDSFAPKLMTDMTDTFAKMSENLQSTRAKQVFSTLAANMTSEFGQRAIGIQGELAAKDAVNKYDVLQKSFGQVAYQDQTQLATSIAQGKAAIDDPNGMFARIPQTSRDKLKTQLENDLNFAAARGYVRHSPTELLSAIAPDMLEQFKPAQKSVEINSAPGSRPNISEGALKWSPIVNIEASAKGVNPNILLAQIDKESRGNPDAINKGDIRVTGSPSIGLSQFQPATAAQYGIDPTKPDQSIKGQAAYMADLLKKYGGDYSKALAAYNWGPGNLDRSLARYGDQWQSYIPSTTKDYVKSIMENSGAVVGTTPPNAPQATDNNPEASGPKSPVTSKLDFFNGLSWEQQDSIVKEAIQVQQAKLSMANRAREEAERAKKEDQDARMNGYYDKIVRPTEKGTFSETDVMNDPVLSMAQKQHLIQTALQRPREIAEKSHPEEVKRLHMQLIADGDDPLKTYNGDAIRESYKNGGISTPEYEWLMARMDGLKNTSTNSTERRAAKLSQQVESELSRTIQGSLDPVVVGVASRQFTTDLMNAIEAKRKENKDPSVLFDPSSREYMGNYQRIMGYVTTAQQTMQGAAAKTIEAGKNDRNPAEGMEVGKEYTVNGKQLVYQGGPVNLTTSWKVK